MEYNHIVCPCCGKEVDIPLLQYSTGFDFNYSILINSEVEFFDLVDICPECGYVMLFDNGISDEMKEYIKSAEYQNILNATGLEDGLRKWLLYAILCEFDRNYTEAGIAYTKAYDYQVLKGFEPDKRLIMKAASNFITSLDEYTSVIDGFLAVDSLRRAGEKDRAAGVIKVLRELFEGEDLEKFLYKEEMLLSLNITEKRYLDI